MDYVPEGKSPHLIGSSRKLGAWDTERSIPLQPIAPGLWHAAVDSTKDSWVEYKYGLGDSGSKKFESFELGENRISEPLPVADDSQSIVHDEAFHHHSSDLPRAAGVAIPVFSLRSEKSLGVGEFADLRTFGDWSSEAGMRLIQILPINDTTSAHDWTDSYPYSAISAFALHPIFLRIDELSVSLSKEEKDHLAKAQNKLNPLPQVDYPAVMEAKHSLL